MKSNSITTSCTLIIMVLAAWSCNISPEKENRVQNNMAIVDTQYVFTTQNLKRYKFPTHINDLVIDRAKSSFSEVFVVIIEPGKSPLFHKHDDTEQIFYITSGTGVLTITDAKKKIDVKPGDVVRIPISTYHTIQADANNTVTYICVDCFMGKNTLEPTWDDHVKVVCNTNNWDFEKVVSNGY